MREKIADCTERRRVCERAREEEERIRSLCSIGIKICVLRLWTGDDGACSWSVFFFFGEGGVWEGREEKLDMRTVKRREKKCRNNNRREES